jgi:hypothetical protein
MCDVSRKGIFEQSSIKGSGIKSACSSGCGAKPDDTNLEKLRQSLSKININAASLAPQKKRYINFE